MAETVAAAASGRIGIELEKIVYGPTDRPGHSRRMIWLTGSAATSGVLSGLKKVLEEKLKQAGVSWRQEDRENFQAHLTLARFEPAPRQNLPPIERPLGWRYEAAGLDLMRSDLRRTGAVYERISSVALQ